jgi:hypothetical protein
VKHALDEERRRVRKQPIWPAAFVEYALPLADGGEGSNNGDVTTVPSELVVGATWSESWEPLPSGPEALALCDRLDALAHNRREPNWAILVRVGSLPLWYAREGKNRMALYRSLARPIVAEVRVSRHPPASDLVVRRGDGVSGVCRAGALAAVNPIAVDAAADLLLAAGALLGPPLADEDAQRLVLRARKRQAFLDTRW